MLQVQECALPYVEIGNSLVGVALALGSSGHNVSRWDYSSQGGGFSSLRQKDWAKDLATEKSVHVKVFREELLKDQTAFQKVLNALFIVLDYGTHQPYSHPFEKEFVDELIAQHYQVHFNRKKRGKENTL
jgi:hypothetical protein